MAAGSRPALFYPIEHYASYLGKIDSLRSLHGVRSPRCIVRCKTHGPPESAGRAGWSDWPIALDLGEDLLEDDPPPGDELTAGPVSAICGKARAGTRPRAGWAGLSGRGRSRPGEPVRRRDLLGRPFDNLRVQPLLLAVADQDPLQVRDLLRRPAQQLPAIPRRVLVVEVRVLGLVSPRRPSGRGRSLRFRVVEPIRRIRVVIVVAGLAGPGRAAPGRRGRRSSAARRRAVSTMTRER